MSAKFLAKNRQGLAKPPLPSTLYFFGFGGLLPAGPPGLPGFVLGLGCSIIGFLDMIYLILIMPPILRFSFRIISFEWTFDLTILVE